MGALNSIELATVQPSSQETLLPYLRAFGRDTVSFQALEPGVHTWRDPSGEGVVAYFDTGAAWVSAGAPLAPLDVRPNLVRRFVAAARMHGRRVCFCAVEQDFDQRQRLLGVHIGAQPVWSPKEWPQTLAGSRNLKEQVRRAKAKQVTIRRAGSRELEKGTALRAKVELLVRRWLSGRKAPPLGFLLDVQLFDFPEERRIFVAERDGDCVGLLAAVPVYARNGWFIEDVLRDPSAPNGTTELLFDAAMRALADEGAERVTMGLVPLAGDGLFFRTLRRVGAWFYDFEGLWRFRIKLRPHAWEPVRICYPESQSVAEALWDASAAVTGGDPIRWLWGSAKAAGWV